MVTGGDTKRSMGVAMPIVSLLVPLLVASPVAIRQTTPPVLWVQPDGQVTISGKPFKDYRITKGAIGINTPLGRGISLDGTRGGMLLPDRPEFKLTKSITVSTWMYLRSYHNDGPGAQVLFRGDDRIGADAYSMVIHGNGTVHFAIWDGQGRGLNVQAEVPLQQWVHVTSSFDHQTGELRMWLNGEGVGLARTQYRPVAEMDNAYAPGLGIGNVQNDRGPHNQPMNGTLVDLRLYNRVVEPAEAGYRSIPLQRRTP